MRRARDAAVPGGDGFGWLVISTIELLE